MFFRPTTQNAIASPDPFFTAAHANRATVCIQWLVVPVTGQAAFCHMYVWLPYHNAGAMTFMKHSKQQPCHHTSTTCVQLAIGFRTHRLDNSKNRLLLPFSPHSALFPSPHPFYLLCFSNNWPFFTILHEPFQFLVVVCCQLFSTATSPCQVQCPRNNTSDRPSTQLCRNTSTYPLVSISLSSNVFARPRPPPQHHTMLIHIVRNQNADVPARHVLLHVQPPCPISPLAICD